ncbi:cupin [Streptomyces sp. JS01]|uniref:cupin domain-containing protein n=1 Tax=Streptomyces TaxID=1883 RepID=UPI000501E38C|nr:MULTISPECIES: cupin [unclassified Streptomyces]KFK86401.1 cupin [Streptomyces sp. JS01]MBK3533500.1 cupin [Streptomyces sp. MBT72]MBK3540572.1 cupin [Streptomyces sp. MBT67]MBK3553010.1 cupin [Streptomyces sp. MBT61]MBK6032694.1 cupin [Streptomyces sp. MBT59]
MVTFEGLPGAVAVSHLTVYDWPAADGLRGGTPHLHLTCSEGYVVVGGSGSVQTLTTAGYRETPLTPGALVWFTPGTIHRLVNEDGLRLIVLMQNSGLPEAGDAVLTLPPRRLTDPDDYRAAVALPVDAEEAVQEKAARARRDLAVEGFLALREAVEDGDPEPLAAFHRAAAALVRPRTGEWRTRWEKGAATAAAATADQLDALDRGEAGHLADAHVHAERPSAYGRFGMCGRLDVYRT